MRTSPIYPTKTGKKTTKLRENRVKRSFYLASRFRKKRKATTHGRAQSRGSRGVRTNFANISTVIVSQLSCAEFIFFQLFSSSSFYKLNRTFNWFSKKLEVVQWARMQDILERCVTPHQSWDYAFAIRTVSPKLSPYISHYILIPSRSRVNLHFWQLSRGKTNTWNHNG